jgi:hypothetical protein
MSQDKGSILIFYYQVWGDANLPFSLLQLPSRPPSTYSASAMSMSIAKPMGAEKGLGMGFGNESQEDLEKDSSMERPESLQRPIVWTSAIFVGLSMTLGIVLLFGFFVSKLLIECVLDGSWNRMALVVTLPFLMCVSLFFFQVIFSNLFQIIGPIGGIKTNSRHYSCHKPSLRRAYIEGFEPPRITIQMPVYKEGMDSVIIPTVRSLQAAISFYESHGGKNYSQSPLLFHTSTNDCPRRIC